VEYVGISAACLIPRDDQTAAVPDAVLLWTTGFCGDGVYHVAGNFLTRSVDLLILGSERLRDKVELELSRVLVGQVSFWFAQLTLQ
jgi:hypothetical protein